MLKELLTFLKTGITLVLFYVFYSIMIFVLTVLLGAPIYFGVQYIEKVVTVLIQ